MLRANSASSFTTTKSVGLTRYVSPHIFHVAPQTDTSFQHRFIETAIGSAGATKAQAIAEKFGFGDIGNNIGALAKNFVGDYLHTF